MADAAPRWISGTPIAHRGLHDEQRPENSMGAFLAAADAGYAIELDVHLAADGQLVVLHDDDTERLTGESHRVTETDAAKLTTLHLAGTEYRIPLLTEVFDAVAGRVPILVEIKTGTAAGTIGPPALAAVRAAGGDVAVQSFDPRIVSWFRGNAPSLPRGQLCGSFSSTGMPALRRLLLRSMVANLQVRPSFLAYEVDALPDAFLAFWRRALGVPLLLWTVRTEDQLDRARRYGANVIFENVRPAAPR